MSQRSRLKPVFIAVSFGVLFLQGCADRNVSEVRAFMEEERNKKGPRIEALPSFPPYVPTNYAAAGLRSPFDPPRSEAGPDPRGNEVDPPDPTRIKEYLERFNVAELKMVGTMEQNGVRWALINDGTGSVHRVTQGNYLGRNHGVIDSVGNSNIEMTEVVVDGRGGWIERPRTLGMTAE